MLCQYSALCALCSVRFWGSVLDSFTSRSCLLLSAPCALRSSSCGLGSPLSAGLYILYFVFGVVSAFCDMSYLLYALGCRLWKLGFSTHGHIDRFIIYNVHLRLLLPS